MDEENDATDPAARTMAEISHANPYTGETAGHLFRRGPVVAADGGREAADNDGAATDADDVAADGEPTNGNGRGTERGTMRDVSHTPPNRSEDANRVFERGRRSAEDGADE